MGCGAQSFSSPQTGRCPVATPARRQAPPAGARQCQAWLYGEVPRRSAHQVAVRIRCTMVNVPNCRQAAPPRRWCALPAHHQLAWARRRFDRGSNGIDDSRFLRRAPAAVMHAVAHGSSSRQLAVVEFDLRRRDGGRTVGRAATVAHRLQTEWAGQTRMAPSGCVVEEIVGVVIVAPLDQDVRDRRPQPPGRRHRHRKAGMRRSRRPSAYRFRWSPSASKLIPSVVAW